MNLDSLMKPVPSPSERVIASVSAIFYCEAGLVYYRRGLSFLPRLPVGLLLRAFNDSTPPRALGVSG